MSQPLSAVVTGCELSLTSGRKQPILILDMGTATERVKLKPPPMKQFSARLTDAQLDYMRTRFEPREYAEFLRRCVDAWIGNEAAGKHGNGRSTK
jgi:hypothetical protein